MTLFYFDTSTLLKRYKNESGSLVVNFIFENKVENASIVTSFLSVIELNGVIARLKKAKALTGEEADGILFYFDQDVEKEVVITPVTDNVLTKAVEISGRHGNRAADSIHAATIVNLNEDAHRTKVKLIAVVSDKHLIETLSDSGITVLNPEERENMTLAEMRELFL